MIAISPASGMSPPLCRLPRVFRDMLIGDSTSRGRGRVVPPRATFPMSGDAAVPSESWAEPQTAEEQRSKVSAEIKVHAPADVLWGVLTDFSSHANLMPNLEQCEQLPSRKSDTELLFQKVFSQTPFWRLEASAMLEYRQKIAKSWRKMNFWMISGDFAELSGHWVVAEDAQTPSHCILRYEIVFLPMCKAAIPCAMKQFLAKQVLPYNIMTLAAHAEQLSQGTWAPQMDAAPAVTPSLFTQVYTSDDRAHLAPGWMPDRRPMYLGVSSVPLPGQRSSSSSTRKRKNKTRDNHIESTASLPWTSSEGTVADSSADAARSRPTGSKFTDVDVHIRKLDTDKRLHRRLLSSVPVQASAEAIWAVLTNYEQLDEVVPLLLVSEEQQALSGDIGRDSNSPTKLKRIRQVAAKQLPYVQLHTEVSLDVLEKPGPGTWELQFKHHMSSFDMLQGKFLIEHVPNLTGSPNKPAHVLKYAVELAVNATPRFIDLMEPLIERSIAEDLPGSLDALRNAAESLYSKGTMQAKKSTGKEVLQRAEKTYELFEELRAELTALYGSCLQLPNRKELLSSGRVDLINAIKAHGGYTQVAEQLQWSVAKVTRRPRGYWSDMANVQHELDLFNDEFDQPIDSVPRKSYMKKLGRYDLIKGIERNGGAHMVAEVLGYTVASGRSAVATPDTVGRDEIRADVGEIVGQELLEEAQMEETQSSLLPSVDDLLMDSSSLSAGRSSHSRTNHDRVRSAGHRNWRGSNHSAQWVDQAHHLGDSLNVQRLGSPVNLGDTEAGARRKTWFQGGGQNGYYGGKLEWAANNNRRKLNLDVRDVDQAHIAAALTPARGAASKQDGRRVLSPSDLRTLLSESADSRDSI